MLHKIKNEIISKSQVFFQNYKFFLKPNFLIPGAGRSGSTGLYQYLKQHPEIFLSETKEPNYFAKNYHLGKNWYLSHFKSLVNSKAVGEASTSYLVYEKATKRIFQFNPNFKFIFILRDPVERAFSHFKWDIQFLGENRSFQELIRRSNKYLLASKYYTHISRFLKFFPKKNMYFLILEKFINNKPHYLKEMCEFLEVSTKFKFDINKTDKNISIMPLSLRLQRLNHKLFKSNPKERITKRSIKYGIYVIISNFNWYFNRKELPIMHETTKLYLKKKNLAEISKLEQLIGIKLDEWKSV